MELLKKCNFVLLALFIWGLTVLYNGVIINYLANLLLSFSNPSWLGFIVHILIQLLIICIPTIIVIKYLDLNVKQLLFSIPVMYLLFAVYSPLPYICLYLRVNGMASGNNLILLCLRGWLRC